MHDIRGGAPQENHMSSGASSQENGIPHDREQCEP